MKRPTLPTKAHAKKIATKLRKAHAQKPVRQGLVLGGVAIVGLVAIAGLGIYGLGWNNAFTGTVSAVVPYQAMSVDGALVSYHTFYNNVVKTRAMTKGSKVSYSAKQLDDQATQKTIGETLTANYARKHKIVVSGDEVKASFDELVAENGGGKVGQRVLIANAGVGEGLIKSELRARLLAIKVDQAISTSPEALSATKTKAQGLIAKINGGADMDALAAANSTVPSGQMTGEKAYTRASTLPRIVSTTAASMKDDQLAAAPINVKGTFYIIKRMKADGNDVLVRMIVLRSPGLSAWLANTQSQNVTVNFLPEIN